MNPATTRTPNGLDMTYHRLAPGAQLALNPRPEQETALILLRGRITTVLPDGNHTAERSDPFTQPAATWYLPPGTTARASAAPDGADAIEVHAPAAGRVPDTTAPTAIAAPAREVRGHGSFERHVTTLLAPPQTAGLLLGETLALDGRWSTYPPHRHQHSNPPAETALQEAFAFRIRPATGFGVLLTYDDSVRDAHPTVITDTSLATVPGGYHTIAAAAGHDLYYLWAAHGDTDTHLALHTDPAHAWLLTP
ncbi:5-deoxy-glucuronate isomerase [Streptomyces galilaeus]|uniref:5-deoxy-glucuronate isomerase n=1 Tax=Streptomyces galilaeus TaxID=33899 RepID=UPI0038F6753B